jgi:hypothetical protein
MITARLPLAAMSILFATAALGANPFLEARDDKPVSVNFRGAEWSDDIPQDEIALTARVTTTRIAKMSWGSVFKIEFGDLKSRAEQHRTIRPEYFVVTDDRIVLLNEEDNKAAAKKLASLDKAPPFEPNAVYGITSGTFQHQEGSRRTEIEVKGDQCIYLAANPSGHFKKVVWKKGVGLVEYSMGYGARADGFRLKREASRKP